MCRRHAVGWNLPLRGVIQRFDLEMRRCGMKLVVVHVAEFDVAAHREVGAIVARQDQALNSVMTLNSSYITFGQCFQVRVS